MRKIPATLSLAIAALVGVLQPAAARAQNAPLPLAAVAFAATAQAPCAATGADASSFSKSEALLGGQVSQLDLLRQQQGVSPAGLAKTGAATTSAGVDCGRLVLPGLDNGLQRPGRGNAPLGSQDFLASKRLPIARTTFDAEWNRVASATLPRSATAAFGGMSAGQDGKRLLAAVNTYANRRIRYVEDRALYGRPDYWANAAATLAKGAGDCEDIAIAKMQLLAAAGVPRSDMFLTIARDTARKADHALLIVRLDGRFWLLDNGSDMVVDAALSYDYRPIFSFSSGGRWLHGY